ncbi:unnamed protein product [Brassica rapa subsp. narinosa]
MRQRHIVTGFDMEQHSHPDTPHMNPVPTFLQEPYDNNSMLNGLPQYPPPPPPHHHHHHHHHQRASNLGPTMSTPPNLYLPYEPLHAHPLAPGSHESNPHFMGHGYKRKSDEVIIPGNYQYLTEPAPPPETAPLAFPHYATNAYPQPMDQRSVRSRLGAVTMDPPYSQGNYPFPPPAPIWYDQHVNDNNTSDGSSSSSYWLQPPSIPFMHGNAAPRFHEASSSRNDVPFAYPTPNYFSHHPAPPPPPTLYPPRMTSASYTVPMTIHDAPYRNVGPVQPTGLRINRQHPRDGFSPAASLRHYGLPPHLRAFPAYEDAFFVEGEFFDDDEVDDHQDMRLDIEDMSYEELLDLSDHIGTVKTGLSEETVKDLVKRRTYISTRINLEEAPSTDLETDSCTICQETYKNRDKIAMLDCKHEYHPACLEKWLVIKNICPICKSEALVMDKNKER